MNVPPERQAKIESIRGLVSVSNMPTTTPIGDIIEKRAMKIMISFKEYPVFAKAPPRETAAAVLCMMIPAASYPPSSISVIRPNATPSKIEWKPRARTRTIAEVLLNAGG